MPQAKLHDSNAHRQAAYRSRKGRPQATQARMAQLANTLDGMIRKSVECSVFPLPAELLGITADQTLANLIRYFDPIYDPERNRKGKFCAKRGKYLLLPADWDTLDWETQQKRMSQVGVTEETF